MRPINSILDLLNKYGVDRRLTICILDLIIIKYGLRLGAMTQFVQKKNVHVEFLHDFIALCDQLQIFHWMQDDDEENYGIVSIFISKKPIPTFLKKRDEFSDEKFGRWLGYNCIESYKFVQEKMLEDENFQMGDSRIAFNLTELSLK